MKKIVEVYVNPIATKKDDRKIKHQVKTSRPKEWLIEINKDLNEIYFISDLHLDHANIIKYSDRPFNSIEEMNHFLVKNWNKNVTKDSLVFFLGDMAFGRKSKTIDYWANKLRGNIIFIKGSHDRSKTIKFYDKLILRVISQRFLLVHDPVRKPRDWNDWVIHGHLHNRDPKYSLVNVENRTINVSVEMINYKPVSLKKLLELCARS